VKGVSGGGEGKNTNPAVRKETNEQIRAAEKRKMRIPLSEKKQMGKSGRRKTQKCKSRCKIKK